MTPLPQHTLPLATTSPFTPWRRATGTDIGGWGSTLDRALQAMSGPGALSRDVATEGKPLRLPVAALAPAPSHHGTNVHPTSAHRAADNRRFDCAGKAPNHSQASWCPSTNSHLPDAPDLPAERAQQCAQVPRHPRTLDPAPVRVHVERHPEGLAIWIGADAASGSDALAAVVRSVRSAQPGNAPLASLVCNGRTVYASPRHPKENP